MAGSYSRADAVSGFPLREPAGSALARRPFGARTAPDLYRQVLPSHFKAQRTVGAGVNV